MNRKNDLLDYLRGDRKGKLANRLEQDALSDPFLYEAIEGLTDVEGDHLKVLGDLDRKLSNCGKPYARFHFARWRVGLLLVIAVALIIYFLNLPVEVRTKTVVTDPKQVEVPVSETPEKGTKIVPEEDTAGRFIEQQQSDMQMDDKPSVEFTGTAKVVANKTGPIPMGGFVKFDQYIKEALRYPEDALRDGTDGDVTLSFIINDKGHPSRIRVVQWVSSSLSQEAIRLLDEGPEWSNSDSSASVLLTIQFVLKK